MAGLNIGHHPFAQDDYKNLNSPLLGNSPTLSPETEDLPQNEMAVLSSECEEDSDCTHEAMCVNRGAMIGKHCFCFETGEICSARPKPQNPPPINVPDTPIWPSTGSSECKEDSDCVSDAKCEDIAGAKHCFCLESGRICNARPKPQDFPQAPDGMATSGPECHDDSGCAVGEMCGDNGLGVKHCFCKGLACSVQSQPQATLCGLGCSTNAICHPSVGCICQNTRKLETNGTCPDDTADTVVPSTTPSNSMHHGVIHKEQLQRILNSTSTNQTTTVVRTQLGAESALLQIVLPLGVLLFLGVVIIIICLRRQRQHRLGPQRSSETVVKSGDAVMLLDRMNNINKNPTYFVSPGDDPTQRKFLVREICMDHIVLVDVVGEGAFGQVYRGELHCPETNSQQLVAVKVLKENVSNEIREDFEREVEIMSAFDHDNILKLVGVVTQNAGQSPYMIFEYMVHGDLAELLRKNDPVLLKKDSDVIRLQKPDLVDIATQIANGMRYLTSQHFVHRDLATRNCLVGEGLVVKISDFGMSRDIYTCDYYKIGGSRMLPVRWMSPESVKYGRFTSESDAWAYGVVLWEIFSCGRQPYYGHSNEEVVRFLDAGILLQRPEDCPSTIYHIMLGCWKADPKERLSFDKIHKHLQDYHQRLVKMAASQSQPSTPASESEVQVKMPEMPESSSPELPPLPEPALLQGPRPKPLLKATQSDPQAGSGKVASPSLVEASRTSSQTLTQHRVQPKPELQPKPQEMMAESPDVVYQVKLPPLQPAAQTPAAAPRPCPQPQLDVQVAVMKSDSPPITAKGADGHSSSLEKLHGTDSGFSSGEQQWDDLVDESTAAATPLIHTPPSGDIILEPLTSIVCTNPTEVV